MRLTDADRLYVLLARPSSTLVRFRDRWLAVWPDPSGPPAARWWCAAIESVDQNREQVWWTCESQAHTRKAAIAQTEAELTR